MRGVNVKEKGKVNGGKWRREEERSGREKRGSLTRLDRQPSVCWAMELAVDLAVSILLIAALPTGPLRIGPATGLATAFASLNIVAKDLGLEI